MAKSPLKPSSIPEALSPADQQAFMESADVRQQRREARLAKLGVYPNMLPRGKRRPAYYGDPNFPYSDVATIEPDIIAAVGRRRADTTAPLFDPLTLGYNIEPTLRAVEGYVEAGVRTRRGKKPQDYDVPVTQEAIDQAKARSRKHIADGLKAATYRFRNIALWRGTAIAVAQRQLAADPYGLLDTDVGLVAGDAVDDYGYALDHNRPVWHDLDKDLGKKVSFIGQIAADFDPETSAAEEISILNLNPELLRVAGEEQDRRAIRWGAVFDITVEFTQSDAVDPQDQARWFRLLGHMDRWQDLAPVE